MNLTCNSCYAQHEQLYTVSGYEQLPPMCLKCVDVYSTKLQLPGFHQQQQQQQSTPQPSAPTAIDSTTLIISTSTPPQDPLECALIHVAEQQQRHEHEQIFTDESVPAHATEQVVVASEPLTDASEFLLKLEQSIVRNGDNDALAGADAQCPHCRRTFARKSALLAHVRNHAADRRFVCSFCQKGFTQLANLRNHERIHRNERPFVCTDCGKAFTQITNLNNHRRLHTGERPFACNEPGCTRAFAQVTNLNNHMKTHHKIQQYVCTQCPKRFTQLTSLNQHLLTHSDAHDFACPLCADRAFRQPAQLSQHMRQHHGAGPYTCAHCAVPFEAVAKLTAHVRQAHAGDALRYRCNVCASAFGQEALLRKHIECHVEDGYISRQFACPQRQCRELFVDRVQLDQHLVNAHPAGESTATAATRMAKKPRARRSKKLQTLHGQQAHTSLPSGAQPAASQRPSLVCFVHGCGAVFEHPDRLSEHLIVAHDVRYRDVNQTVQLMFVEQFRQQISSAGHNGTAGMQGHEQPQQHQQQPYIKLEETHVDRLRRGHLHQESQPPHNHHHPQTSFQADTGSSRHHSGSADAATAARPAEKIECRLRRRGEDRTDDGGHGGTAARPQFHGADGVQQYNVCPICYNVFKSLKTLTRHRLRFHGTSAHPF